jgi:ribosomal-protein-alanine N-acetyltransferase
MLDDRHPPHSPADAVASIVSRRLELVSLGPREIRALLDTAGPALDPSVGFVVPDGTVLGERTLRRRLAQMETDPGHRPWLLRAIVERRTRVMCGRIGFHAPPAPVHVADTVADGVELGYEVAPVFRRRGYAREAALALMRWAFEMHGQRVFVLSISPENGPSLAMARALGFIEHGSQMDDEDGLELVFHRRLDAWPGDWDLSGAE